MMRKVLLFIYYSFLQYLPSSFFPLGNVFNFCRVQCLKKVMPLGLNNKIQNSVYVGLGANVDIGNNCQINEKVKLDNVSIGDFVMIASGVNILGKMHEFSDLEKPMILQGEKNVAQTKIEKNVWIGANAIIMPV